MRRMSKLFAHVATFGTAVVVFLSARPAFAQSIDAVRADRDKWLAIGAALAIGLSALGGGIGQGRAAGMAVEARGTRNEQEDSPEPVVGKSYLCRREGGPEGDLRITYDDGGAEGGDVGEQLGHAAHW